MKKLILVRGLPGSGKSTFAEMYLLGATDAIRVEADDYFYKINPNTDEVEYNFDASQLPMAHKYCKDVVEQHMMKGTSTIAVSNTFTQEWEMDTYVILADVWGYDITRIIVENHRGSKSVHGVDESTLERMRNRFNIKL